MLVGRGSRTSCVCSRRRARPIVRLYGSRPHSPPSRVLCYDLASEMAHAGSGSARALVWQRPRHENIRRSAHVLS